jgi:pimeloyl-ACP methyl ester carboxylesterase
MALARRDAEPARLRAQASLYEEYEPNGERVARDGRDWGDLPLIVISAGAAADGGLWSPDARDEHAALFADWADSHKSLAKLSRRGERRVAEGSGHLVQLQKPQAVIEAVLDVVKAARAR